LALTKKQVEMPDESVSLQSSKLDWNRDSKNAQTSDALVAETLRRIMPDSYFINTPRSHMQRHLELLRAMQPGDVVLDFHRHAGALLTELTLCAFDETRPGLLSKVCGALAALGIEIRNASVYTLRLPNEEPGDKRPKDFRHVALDTLLLSEPYYGKERALTRKTIERVRASLTDILQNRTSEQKMLAQVLSRSRRQSFAPPHIIELAVSNREMGEGLQPLTEIRLRATDTSVLLYRVTAALASLGLNIHMAQINSLEGEADDIFLVSNQAGRALPESELAPMSKRLRLLLQSAAIAPGVPGEI